MSVATVVLDFVKGSDPPERLENEPTDDFQGRMIVWLRQELKAQRALIWLLVSLNTLAVMGIKVPV